MTKPQSTAAYVLRLTLTLFLITVIVAGLLAFVNYLTADTIAEHTAEAARSAMTQVLAADDYTELPVSDAQAATGVTAAWSAGDAGAVVRLTTNGFGGAIDLMVGVDNENKVTGVAIISHSETASLGANCARGLPRPVCRQDRRAGRQQGRRRHRRPDRRDRHVPRRHPRRERSAGLCRGGAEMNFKKQLREGLLTNNPVVGQLLGMCSTMAITTTLFNGLGMGLSVTLILICSNVVISMLRKVIPDKIRIAAYIVVIAGFVTIIDLLLQAYLPALSKSLGVFIPLIVVNCIILGRAEAFASKNGVLASAVDGLTQGIGYTVALVCMCVIRELLGSGTFGKGVLSADGVRILPSQYPAMLMILPVGGFLTLACLIAFTQWFNRHLAEKAAKKEAEAK